MSQISPDALRALQDELDRLDAQLNDLREPVEPYILPPNPKDSLGMRWDNSGEPFAATKLRPRGGDELVSVPDEVEIDPADVGDAWSEVMPTWVKGLLDTGEV
jgi:hypothetical protein